jgi:hypothetical protein
MIEKERLQIDVFAKYRSSIITVLGSFFLMFLVSWIQLNSRISVVETRIENQKEIKINLNEIEDSVNELKSKVNVLIDRSNVKAETFRSEKITY